MFLLTWGWVNNISIFIIKSLFFWGVFVSLPLHASRLLSSLSLRKLLAGNNRLERLADLLDHIPLETLDLQHNNLRELPESFFYKALKSVTPSFCPLSVPLTLRAVLSFSIFPWVLLCFLWFSACGRCSASCSCVSPLCGPLALLLELFSRPPSLLQELSKPRSSLETALWK